MSYNNLSLFHCPFEKQIQTIFEDILKLDSIKHCSIDIFNPKLELLSINHLNMFMYKPYHEIIDPLKFENYEFYWWDCFNNNLISRIRDSREEFLKLNHGFVLVRKLDDHYLLYSFTTTSNSINLHTKIINNINTYFEMADDAYNKLREIYIAYLTTELPKITTFYAYVGGSPLARYTHISDEKTRNRSSTNKVIKMNFKSKLPVTYIRSK